MKFPDLTRGSVIRYSFLWSREAGRGETEGRKSRESVIVSRFQFDDKDQIVLIPITASGPTQDQIAYELPETEVRRLSRGGKTRLWIILSEVNFDIVGESFHIEPDCRVGELSPRVFAEIWKQFLDALATAKRVDRKK